MLISVDLLQVPVQRSKKVKYFPHVWRDDVPWLHGCVEWFPEL
jgi:hypothetical protein